MNTIRSEPGKVSGTNIIRSDSRYPIYIFCAVFFSVVFTVGYAWLFFFFDIFLVSIQFGLITRGMSTRGACINRPSFFSPCSLTSSAMKLKVFRNTSFKLLYLLYILLCFFSSSVFFSPPSCVPYPPRDDEYASPYFLWNLRRRSFFSLSLSPSSHIYTRPSVPIKKKEAEKEEKSEKEKAPDLPFFCTKKFRE